MKKMFFAILLLVMGILFSSTAFAHDDEAHAKEAYEEGSGGSSMDMGHKAGAMAHEYKGEHAGGAEHSKEYYEKKYGKFEHEKQGMQEEGSGMKEDARRMQKMEQKRMEEGSRM